MDVKLPKLGEGADSGVVVSIFVKEGDAIAKGQTLLELENEKAVAPIPSPAAGKVTKLRVKEGDKLSVGQVILVLAGESAGAAEETASKSVPARVAARKIAARPVEPAPAPVEPVGVEVPASTDTPSPFPPPASPTIRKLARELGINLAHVRGSERGGRIVMDDVRDYIQRLQSQTAPARAETPAPTPARAESIDFSQWGPVTRKAMTPLRKVISRRMSENWNTVPHVTQFDEADITALLELRKKHAAAYEAQNAKLTLTSFALKIVAACLQKHPIFNTSLDEATADIVFKDYFHVGIAVDTEAGLIVPVIRDVNRKSLLELSRELAALAVKARDRKVNAEELKGGTFTISNQGGIGGAHFTPIVNKPEVAILGLGKGAAKPVVRGGKIEPRMLLPLALSYDHRVIDGGSAARFIADLVQAFENFPAPEAKL